MRIARVAFGHDWKGPLVVIFLTYRDHVSLEAISRNTETLCALWITVRCEAIPESFCQYAQEVHTHKSELLHISAIMTTDNDVEQLDG
jgi:hypothetical protein